MMIYEKELELSGHVVRYPSRQSTPRGREMPRFREVVPPKCY